jgi:hypothetical protein
VIPVPFGLFEVILKQGGTSPFAFKRNALVRAAEYYVNPAGNEVWFCSTAQPNAFRQHLETCSDVEYFREID